MRNINIGSRRIVLALLVCVASFARAGFTNVAYLDGSYDATQPLQNGTIYFVTNSIEITGTYDGKSGLAVAPGAEVVIFVQEDCRLYVRGNDGDTGGMGGGAGGMSAAGGIGGGGAGGGGGSGGNGGYYCWYGGNVSD